MSSRESADWVAQWRRGVIELCILRLVSRGPSYGYDIVATLDRYRSLASGENTIYPLLRRLKQDGMLETFSRASPSGPSRQYYQCTAAGRRRLADLERHWRMMSDDVDAFLKQL